MKTEVIQALEKQAAHEFTAAQTYLAMSCWCEVELDRHIFMELTGRAS